MTPIRVLLVDDHLVVRRGLRSMLAGTDDVEIIGEAASGPEAMEQVRQLQPDLALVDIRMPGMDGLRLVNHLKQIQADLKIIILTIYDDEQFLLEAFRAGVHAYLLKNVGREELLEALRTVSSGKRMLSEELMDTVLNQFSVLAQEQLRQQFGLSDTELQLVGMIAEGSTNREIAERMYWSEATVKRKLSDVYHKLDVLDRTQAVAVATRYGLL